MTRSGMDLTSDSLASMAWNDIGVMVMISLGLLYVPVVVYQILQGAKRMDEEYAEIDRHIARRTAYYKKRREELDKQLTELNSKRGESQ